MSQRLIGPKVFELERMMAIFHSITNYQVKQTVHIHSQVRSLIITIAYSDCHIKCIEVDITNKQR